MNQGVLFLETAILGVAIAFFFDLTRVLRKVFVHKNYAVQIEDALFWIVASFGVLYFILNYAYGQIRFFYLIGILLGMILYFNTLSPFIINILTRLFKVIIKIFIYILNCIYKLFYPLVVLSKRGYFFLKYFLLVSKNKINILLQKLLIYVKMEVCRFLNKIDFKKYAKNKKKVKKKYKK